VDLRIEAGELVSIVGPSGSGKSTLLHILGTLDRPTEGSVRIAGLDVSTMSDRDLSALRAWRIGFVFQSFFLLGGESAIDNVADGLLYRGVAPKERRRVAVAALRTRGARGPARHRPGCCPVANGSGRDRAGAGRPAELVLADEPTKPGQVTGAGRISTCCARCTRRMGPPSCHHPTATSRRACRRIDLLMAIEPATAAA
jgi:putative ABC transport system ATP-binding protein